MDLTITITRRKLALDKAREMVQRVRLQHPGESAKFHLAEIEFSLRRSGFQASYAALILEAASMTLGLGRQPPSTGAPPLSGSTVSLSHSLSHQPYPPQIAARYSSLFARYDSMRPHLPADPSPSPAALISLCRATLESIRRPHKPTADELQAFELQRRVRRRKLRAAILEGGKFAKPRWNPPISGDFAAGPLLLPDGTPNPSIRTEGLEHVDWCLLTTFPVFGPDLELHARSRDGLPIWNSTAKKITVLQQYLLPTAQQSMLWTDANSSWRSGGLGTNPKDLATQYAFKLTLPMLSSLRLKVVAVAQAGNRAMLVSSLLPSHVRTSIPPITRASFAASAEDFDVYWRWSSAEEQSLDPRKWRPLNGSEKIIYLHLNVLDAQQQLPYQPLSVFVRRFLGQGSTLFLFAPHPCNLDAWQYSRSNFGAAAEEIERVMMAVEAVKTGVVTPRAEPPFLRNFFRPPELNQVWLQSATEGGTLTTCVAIRHEEQERGEAYSPSTFEPSLISLATLHLCRSDDDRLLYSYSPHLNPHHPPSIIGDLVWLFSSMNLNGLARREDAVHAGTLQPGEFDYEVLADARESGLWREKLEEIGVEELFFVQGKQFHRGVYLKEPTLRPITQDTRRRAALSAANAGATLFFSCHSTAHYADPLALVRGVLATRSRTNTVQVSVATASNETMIKHLSTSEACADCRQRGATKCVYRYREAVEAGVVQGAVGAEEVITSLESWLLILETHSIRGRSRWSEEEKAEFRLDLEQSLELAKQWIAFGRN